MPRQPSRPSMPVPTVPPHILATSPVRSRTNFGQKAEIPLHLIALIVSYIDDVADIARLTRTSRLLYYMTLPKLYETVTLRSYADIRYSNGRPEGYGSGSPFSMGLNALVSRPIADYVYNFRVIGEWREQDMEDYSKGRVPDNSMMLNIALRAALDRMKLLKSFAWELNTKPMQTIYQGIMAKPSITSLVLRCPTTRVPRPTVLIPPLPNLRRLAVYDIDPLSYPDDISLLLVTTKELEELTLHWNPRMRLASEESVHLMTYFGRCLAAKHTMTVKRLSIYNLYTRNMGGFEDCFSQEALEELTLINSMGSSDPMTVFLDDTWRLSANARLPKRLKMMRGDGVDQLQVEMLGKFEGMDRFYIIDKQRSSKPSSVAETPNTPATSVSSPANGVNEHQCKNIASDYLATIQENHNGMRHLLLSNRWLLGDEALLRLVQACPNLEQFGFASTLPALSFLRKIVSCVPKLFALRLLIRSGTAMQEMVDGEDSAMHEFALGQELWRSEYNNLKYIGLGDLIYELGSVVNRGKRRADRLDSDISSLGPIRVVKKLDRETVKHIEIWGLDTTELCLRP